MAFNSFSIVSVSLGQEKVLYTNVVCDAVKLYWRTKDDTTLKQSIACSL